MPDEKDRPPSSTRAAIIAATGLAMIVYLSVGINKSAESSGLAETLFQRPGKLEVILPYGVWLGATMGALSWAMLLGGLMGVLKARLHGRRGIQRVPWVIPAIVGLLAGVLFFPQQDAWRDQRRFERARDAGHWEALRDYLQSSHGMRTYHEAEVRDALLPEAVFALINKKDPKPFALERYLRKYGESGDHPGRVKRARVAAIRQFITSFPKHARRAELQAALPGAALDAVRDLPTVAPLRAFVKEFPDVAQTKTARQLIHGHYERALSTFTKAASRTTAELVPFVKRLLEHLERYDHSSVKVYFHAPSTEKLQGITGVLQQALDAAAKSGKRPKTTVAPIEPHFSAESTRRHRQRITADLASAFGTIFHGNILEIAQQSELLSADQEPSAFSDPSVVVGFTPRLSGAQFILNNDPKRTFVGVTVDFDVKLYIPGDNKPLSIAFSVSPPKTMNTTDTSDSGIYGTIVGHAFMRLQRQLKRALFAESSKRP